MGMRLGSFIAHRFSHQSSHAATPSNQAIVPAMAVSISPYQPPAMGPMTATMAKNAAHKARKRISARSLNRPGQGLIGLSLRRLSLSFFTTVNVVPGLSTISTKRCAIALVLPQW